MEAHSKFATGRKSGRLFVVMSLMENVKTNVATLLLMTTQSSHRLRMWSRIRPTSSLDGKIITVSAKRFRCAEASF